VALLSIQTGSLTPFLNIGNSADVRAMTPVITIGYPMDSPVAPDFGFVAGLDQKFLGGGYLPTTHIRANVHVQSGEQGAPILNVKGEVVGILALGIDHGAACEALPIQAAEKVRKDYTRFGEPRYGWIGVTVEPVIEGDENCELKVSHLDENTPAAHSGLKDGDILVSVGNKQVKKFGDLRDASFFLTAEEMVAIVVRRDDKDVKLDVRAANPPGKVALNPQPRNDNATKLSLPQVP
jgi:serine protease Do